MKVLPKIKNPLNKYPHNAMVITLYMSIFSVVQQSDDLIRFLFPYAAHVIINSPAALILAQVPAIDSTDRIAEHVQQITNATVWISYTLFAVSVSLFTPFPPFFSKFLLNSASLQLPINLQISPHHYHVFPYLLTTSYISSIPQAMLQCYLAAFR